MNAPEISLAAREFAAPNYTAYAQLAKMLLPSSGCLAIYAVDGELSWCSDGFERPDFRVLVEEFRRREHAMEANQGKVRRTAAGVSALVARLCDEQGQPLGYVLIELGSLHTDNGSSMAASLIRPVLICLAAQLSLERPPAPMAAPSPAPGTGRLNLLLGLAELDLGNPKLIKHLLQRCVDRLDCLSAVFCVPEYDLTEVAERASLTDAAMRARLDGTRQHLLAWVQLNNRPMVVNGIDTSKAPYKILSCPVSGRDGTATGLLALFRAADGVNFELDDVRLIEFLSRFAMALLDGGTDSLTGLLSRGAFESHLDDALAAPADRPAGRLLYLDVADLAGINEAFGYVAGDEVIRRAGQLIQGSLRPNERACRLAGDRFVIHLPERNDAEAAKLGAAIAAAASEFAYAQADRRVPLVVRFGVAPPPARKAVGRHWIAAAERACRPS